MLRLSVECYSKRAQPQYVDVVAIRKIASVEDYRLETDVSVANSGMGVIYRQAVLRGPSGGIVPILVRHRVSFSTALVPQLQLWQSVGDLHSSVP
jgi:hypothetical protein